MLTSKWSRHGLEVRNTQQDMARKGFIHTHPGSLAIIPGDRAGLPADMQDEANAVIKY